ncbi:MAG TPA: DUF885 domain-containing protein [Tepidisphaeraceae bacterium]|jgi:prolyl oligopeptidase
MKPIPTILLTILITTSIAAADASKDLHDLFRREWDWTMEQNPTRASTLGDRRWNDRWEDLSLAAIDRRQEHQKATLAALQQINRAELNSADQLSYDLFADQLNRSIEQFPFKWYLLPVNQRNGIQTEYELADQLRFQTLKDYEDYLARLRAFPEHMDQTIELMRAGMAAGIMHPKVIMQRVPAQIDKVIVEDPKNSAYYKPFKKFPAAISEEKQRELASAAQQVLAEQVIPAYRKFKPFFENEYLPKCLDSVGIWQLPQGEQMYAFFARRYTTTDLSPDQIHELGLREVSRIDAEMDRVMKSAGFAGTREQFFEFLRSDPRFFYKSGDELLEASRALAKRIDPKLVKVFKTLPRMPYGVEPVPMAVAPDTTAAYYNGPADDGSRAGTYYVNIYKPESRPKWEMMALTLHESVPGHHLQISRAIELGEIPEFRRHGGYTAFVEGWGLYAESLGEDMGLYDDPYDRFGKLTYEMWRAVRLVVDTGIHHKKWTRQQAIDYFKQHAPKTDLDIVNEIDRYITMPGQALAYKVGELKIKELRARAQSKLGDKFDLREFHDVVLGSGAVPLDVLERIVDEWIGRGQK